MINRKEAEAKLLERAARDPEFKRVLLSNPRGAIETEFGVSLPATLDLKVVEEKPDEYYLVLPLNPEGRGDAELSDAQLDAVAAGDGCYFDFTCSSDECGAFG